MDSPPKLNVMLWTTPNMYKYDNQNEMENMLMNRA
jgi:hypothetical protein